MRYFAELDGDKLVQIHHTEISPQDPKFNYVEITKEDFPKSWSPPIPGDYLAYSNGFYWKSSMSEQEIKQHLETELKNKRNKLLEETDWTQLTDISPTIKEKYKDYRQQLRDITIQSGYPTNVVWPQKPIE